MARDDLLGVPLEVLVSHARAEPIVVAVGQAFYLVEECLEALGSSAVELVRHLVPGHRQELVHA